MKLFKLFVVFNLIFCQSIFSKSRELFVTTSDGVKLYVKVSGTGSPCMFVHGGPGAWSYNFEALGGRNLEGIYTMIYYDQRGSGRSENAPDGNYSIKRMSADIDDIRKALGYDKISLLSHSFGGIMAVNYASAYPEKMRKLILLNSTLNLDSSMKSMIINGARLLSLPDKNEFSESKASLREQFGKMMSLLNEKNMFYKLQYESEKALHQVDSVDALLKEYKEFGQKAWGIDEYFLDQSHLTSSIKVPVLVISGKKDFCVGVDHYKLFHFPDQHLSLIDSGHIIYLERNKEFVEAVKNFEKKTSGKTK